MARTLQVHHSRLTTRFLSPLRRPSPRARPALPLKQFPKEAPCHDLLDKNPRGVPTPSSTAPTRVCTAANAPSAAILSAPRSRRLHRPDQPARNRQAFRPPQPHNRLSPRPRQRSLRASPRQSPHRSRPHCREHRQRRAISHRRPCPPRAHLRVLCVNLSKRAKWNSDLSAEVEWRGRFLLGRGEGRGWRDDCRAWRRHK